MAPRMPRVYLIRHGETEWSINGRHTGVSDIPLTANGEKQMFEKAPIMCGPGKLIDPSNLTHIFVSPRLRAQRTASILLDTCSPETKNDIHWITTEEVGEWKYGAYEGMLSKDIDKQRPGWKIWRDGCPSDEEHEGESAEQMQARVDAVIAKVRQIHIDAEEKAKQQCDDDDHECIRKVKEHADVLIVSHGHFSRVFIARWCGFPLAAGTNFSTDPGGLTLLGYQHGTLAEPSVLGVNWFAEPK